VRHIRKSSLEPDLSLFSLSKLREMVDFLRAEGLAGFFMLLKCIFLCCLALMD